MKPRPARKHHYVPRFILRPWTIDGRLHGYYWDNHKQEVRVRKLGVSAFCHQLDLLSLETSNVRPDKLEMEFFGHVDDQGAKVAAKLDEDGPDGLNADDRSNFGRLLMSLDARRPHQVATNKEKGAQYLHEALDRDPEIREAFEREGIDKEPSDFWQAAGGGRFADLALLTIQNIVDNPRVGKVLINAHWRVYHLGSGDGSLVLSDRPLIRTGGYDKPNTVWVLPLSPTSLFVAANSASVIQNFDRLTSLRLRKRMNESSLDQMDRYVFMSDESNFPLVSKRLRL